jgi:hypothetical protein
MLFFFVWGAFVGRITMIASEYHERFYLLPTVWRDQTKYLLYMLSFWPRVLSLFLVAALLAVGIRHREWRWIQLLRAALGLFVVTQLAAVFVDSFFFPAILRGAAAGLFYPSVFLLYLFFSTRVAAVFRKPHSVERNGAVRG